jgi:cytidylate kinase
MPISVIAIGGPHGSGKSSVAKRVASDLGMNYISAGDVFRQMAKERGISLKEFSRLVINEPEIDRQIDDRTRELGSNPNTIVDAQLAAHFTPEDAKLKICITARPDIRYQRIASRENRSFEDAKQETTIREEAEFKRFKDLYNIDVNDMSCYDVVINSDRLNFEETVNIALVLIKSVL